MEGRNGRIVDGFVPCRSLSKGFHKGPSISLPRHRGTVTQGFDRDKPCVVLVMDHTYVDVDLAFLSDLVTDVLCS